MAEKTWRPAVIELADKVRKHRAALTRLGSTLAEVENVLRDVAQLELREDEAKAAARDAVETLVATMQAMEAASHDSRIDFAASLLLIDE